MDKDLKDSRISVVVHAIAAVTVAYASVQMGGLLAGVLGLAVLIALGFLLQKVTGKRGLKWWLSNGLIIYLFLWLVGWIFFFNISL